MFIEPQGASYDDHLTPLNKKTRVYTVIMTLPAQSPPEYQCPPLLWPDEDRRTRGGPGITQQYSGQMTKHEQAWEEAEQEEDGYWYTATTLPVLPTRLRSRTVSGNALGKCVAPPASTSVRHIMNDAARRLHPCLLS
jgi:hypothetical protein